MSSNSEDNDYCYDRFIEHHRSRGGAHGARTYSCERLANHAGMHHAVFYGKDHWKIMFWKEDGQHRVTRLNEHGLIEEDPF